MGTPSVDPHIAGIQSQVLAIRRGDTNTLNCPYCKKHTTAEDNALCCPDRGLVIRAIYRNFAQQACVDQAARIADRIEQVGLN